MRREDFKEPHYATSAQCILRWRSGIWVGAVGKLPTRSADVCSLKISSSYRNFLMACAALMDQQAQPMYFPLLDTPTPPGVRHLQHWIEDAWAKGTGHLRVYAVAS